MSKFRMQHLLRKISRPQTKQITLWIGVGLIVLALGACEKPASPSAVTAPEKSSPSSTITPQAISAVESLWQTAAGEFQLSVIQVRSLRAGVTALLANPNQQTYDDARQAWHSAHNQFQTLAVFFAIADSNPGLFGSLSDYHYQIDGQPIQPGFIDYFEVYSQSGIVNDMAITLSAEALRHQHGITDSSDISIGFHAMEYLLWGEQGQRPVSDFAAVATVNKEQAELGLRPIDLPNNRRRVYLQLLAELLVDDSEAVNQYWNDQSGDLWKNYQQLQADSRLQLWQNAVSIAVAELQPSDANATLPVAEENLDSEEDGNENDSDLGHNQFALQQSQLLKAQLTGLGLLLFGNASKATESNPAVDTGLAQWVLPGLQARDPNNEATPDQTTSNQALSDLQQSFQQVIMALNSESTWPLSASSQQSLNELIDTLAALLKSPRPSL